MSDLKEYLGDAVYVDFDGYSLVLTTENGFDATNTVILEPEIYSKLTRYVERLIEQRDAEAQAREAKRIDDKQFADQDYKRDAAEDAERAFPDREWERK